MEISGFTLLELLVSIGITAILLSIMVPTLLNAKRAANDSNAASITRNVVTQAEMKRSTSQFTGIAPYPTATNCAPDFYTTLPNSINAVN